MSYSRLLLIRYGEIGIKGRNRKQFISSLVQNLRHAVRRTGVKADIYHTYGRIYLEWNGEEEQAVYDAVRSTFGVVSFSPAVRVENEVDVICNTAAEALTRAARSGPVRTFKVEARRSHKAFPLTSIELNRTVGSFVARQHPDIRVDVHNPDVIVAVEVRSEGTLVYSEVMPGLGGLPVGTSSKAMLLLSGGIDSPVAAWFALKRGIRLEAVHFHSYPFTSDRSLQKVKDLTRVLTRYAGPLALHVVHFTDVQTAIQRHVPDSYGITIMRRFMFRIAERLAELHDGQALVTGESVGQVASQTLESMRAINEVTTMPVLRPLIGMDKMEIIEHAQAIGTYELSILPYEDCCTLFVPRHPQTRPRIADVLKIEANLPVDELVQGAVERTELEIIHPENSPARAGESNG